MASARVRTAVLVTLTTLVAALYPAVASAQIVIGSGPGTGSLIRVVDPNTDKFRGLVPYVWNFSGGVRVAMGDVNGDGTLDIIAGAGPGGGPHVRVFNGTDFSELASFYAYDPAFAGGVSVAAGDVDGDGLADIITGAGPGGGPHVRVFSLAPFSELASFYAYDPAFVGGVSVAAGDVDGDGLAEIITGAGPGGGPHVRVFGLAPFSELASFYAYDPAFVGGVSVASGDFDGDGRAEIITGAGSSGGPHVRVLNLVSFTEQAGFYAFDPVFVGGVSVGAVDFNGDGRPEIVTGAGPGGGSHVIVFDLNGTTLTQLAGFFAFYPSYPSGVFIGSVAGGSARPHFTSANTTTFAERISGTFTVTTSGSPTPAITVTGALPAGVTFVDNGTGTGTLAGTPAAGTSGTYPLTFTASNGVGTPVTQSFTLTVAEPGAPTLTSVSPNLGLRGTTVAVTLTGTNFVVAATTVTVTGSGVTVNSVVVGSSTSLAVTFVLDPAAAEGPRTVTVTTAGGTSGAQIFTVAEPGAPTLTSVSPNLGIRGTMRAYTLTGTNFIGNQTTVAVGGSGVTVTNVMVSSSTSLTANFVIDPTAPDGFRTVTVTTFLGTSGPRVFTITGPAPLVPTLMSVAPNQGVQGSTVAVILTGSSFVVGATTVNVSGSGVTVTNVTVGNSTSLTANFVLDPTAATDARTVTVNNRVATSGAQTFTITLPTPGAPTLTSVSPSLGIRGTTAAVTLTGTNFVVGATTVNVSGSGVTVNTVTVGNSTSLTANFVLDPTAADGFRTVTVTTAAGTSGARIFTISPPAPTLTSVSPNLGLRGETVAVTLTGTNFAVGATTVSVSADVTVANVVVSSSTSLSANFVLDLVPLGGPRTVTVTTAGGTSGPQTFTITLPPPGSATFTYTGGEQRFTVPAGVVAITIDATGSAGGKGSGADLDPRSMGGRTTATVSVVPGTLLTVYVGGSGPDGQDFSTPGGFNGGGASAGNGGGGGGASSVSVRDGSIPLPIAGGGGGGGGSSDLLGGVGGAGGGLTAVAGGSVPLGGGGGGGATQAAGGGGGTRGNPGGTDGTAGIAGTGGVGGIAVSASPVRGGGGGGGGYFGGGGGGGYFGGGGGGGGLGDIDGGGGGGGSSFAAPGAIGVVHQQGVNTGAGSVTITW